MSIMSDARLRLLEARVAEIERRLAEAAGASAVAATPRKAQVVKKGAPKPPKRGRKTT